MNLAANQNSLRPAKSSNPAQKKTTKASMNNRNTNLSNAGSKSLQNKMMSSTNVARNSYTNDVVLKRKHSYTPNMSAMASKHSTN